jgi:hypothetical protein
VFVAVSNEEVLQHKAVSQKLRHVPIWQVCWPQMPIRQQGQAQQILDFAVWLVQV